MAVVVAHTGTANNIRMHRGRCMVYTSATTGYLFVYNSATTRLVYKKTTDGGATWGAAVSVSGTTVPVAFDIYYRGWDGTTTDSKIYIVYASNASGIVAFNTLDTSTDTVGSPVTIGTVTVSTTVGSLGIVVSRSAGTIIVFSEHNVNTTATQWKSTDGGANWNPTTGNMAELQGAAASNTDQAWAFPDRSTADPDDVCCIYFDDSANELSIKQYDMSGDSVAETSISLVASMTMMSAGVESQRCFAAAMLLTGHLIVALKNNITAAGDDLLCFDVSGATVTAKTDVLTNTQYASTPALSVHANGNVYCFYTRDSGGASISAVEVYYKISTDGGASWGSEQTYQTADDVNIDMLNVDLGGRVRSFLIAPAWYKFDAGNPTFSVESANGILVITGTPGKSGKAPGRGRGNPNPGGGGIGGGGFGQQQPFAYRKLVRGR